jgi:hypothetical protein
MVVPLSDRRFTLANPYMRLRAPNPERDGGAVHPTHIDPQGCPLSPPELRYYFKSRAHVRRALPSTTDRNRVKNHTGILKLEMAVAHFYA